MTDRLISAVPVPFTREGEVDRPALESALAGLAPHVDGVLMAGTTGEFPALEDDERIDVFAAAVEVLGAPRVIAHLGHGSSRQVLRLAERVRGLGIDRLALLTPYYLPTDDDGVVSFFSALSANHSDASLYAYLFPERTGMDVTPETLGRVMQLPGLAGVKLSGGASARMQEYAAVVGDSQRVWSGDDATFPPVVAAGGAGVVSGVSAAFPQTFGALSAAITAHDQPTVERLQDQVVDVVRLVGPTVTRLKVAMKGRTGHEWASRMALPAVDDELAARITDAVSRCG